MKPPLNIEQKFSSMSLLHQIFVCFVLAIGLQIAILVCVAMVSLVREAWDPPTFPSSPDHYTYPGYPHRPPQDVIDAGRVQMALEMKQWSDGE